MIKYLKYLCLVLTFILIGVLLYEKSRIKILDYDEFYTSTIYDFEQIQSFFRSSESIGLENYFYEDVTSIDDLIEHSDYAGLVRVEEKEVYGDGIINHALVLKNLKGLKENEKIEFYDLALSVRPNVGAIYIGGATPLKKGDEYFVFLKDLVHPNRKGALMLSNIEYGYFRNNSDTPILTDYDPRLDKRYFLNELLDYDFVTLVDSYNCYTDIEKETCLEKRDFTNYLNIKKDILEKYNS